MSQYTTYPNLWSAEYLEPIFVVRIPASLTHLNEATYQALMEERLAWMIGRWLEDTDFSPLETQKLLVTSLSTLEPSQDHPLLYQQEDEEMSRQTWQETWAETFIRYNYRFSQMLSLQGIQFPVTPLTQAEPEFQRLMEIHQDTYLEEWLVNLMP